MISRKISHWMRARKTARLKKNLKISEQQAQELQSIMSHPHHRGRRPLSSEDAQEFQKILSGLELDRPALDSLIENRLHYIKLKMDYRAQAFTTFIAELNQTQRIALSQMMTVCAYQRRRHYRA